MKKIVVIGLGISGRSAARFLLEKGCDVVAIDDRFSEMAELEEIKSLRERGMVFLSTEAPLCWEAFDGGILSPGISRNHPVVRGAASASLELIDEMELGARYLQGSVVGITGTNGKTTVARLCEHVLKMQGKKVRALGNIGVPLTTCLMDKDPEEMVILEASSYQLETMRSQIFDAAVILNITPNHLDRYASMEEYAAAKWRIADCVKEGGELFVYEQISCIKKYCSFGTSSHADFYTDKESAFSSERVEYILPLGYRHLGIHESLNALAAYLLCRKFGVTGMQFATALETFKKPSHRIEFVKEIQGVLYFDDSKGSNIHATIQAVMSMQGDVILIAGGMDKGTGYAPWRALKGKVREIIVLGQAAEKIKEELCYYFGVTIVKTLQEAVQMAAFRAKKGDSVLLSPGCSSFDMFRDYAHRGEEFQRFVNLLMRKKDEP